MDTPHSHITCVSNVFIKQMRFLKAGDTEQGHAHNFDHVTLLSVGSLRLNALGKSTDFKAPHHIFIKAGVVHELVALEDNTLAHCIHALRDGSRVEDIVDPASVPISYRKSEVDIDFYPLTEDQLSRKTIEG
jgi:hypothetical protein